MRESHWRAALAYVYVIIGAWGTLVMIFTPLQIEGALGADFTKVWTACAAIGGPLAAAGVLVALRHGRLYAIAEFVEMLANVAIILAVLLYNISLWGFVAAGLTERIGLAVVIHLLAMPSTIRVMYFLFRFVREILVSLAPEVGVRK